MIWHFTKAQLLVKLIYSIQKNRSAIKPAYNFADLEELTACINITVPPLPMYVISIWRDFGGAPKCTFILVKSVYSLILCDF